MTEREMTIRCPECKAVLAVRAGEAVLIRFRGRTYEVPGIHRIECRCGTVWTDDCLVDKRTLTE